MYIDEYKETIDHCRFCWMCRNVCTQGCITSKEVHTARAISLILAAISRNARAYDMDTAKILFQCCQCGFCKEWCVSKYDMPEFIRAGRTDAIHLGFIPEEVKKAVKSLKTFGHPFAEEISDMDATLNAKIHNISSRGKGNDILLYLGSFARFLHPEISMSAINILEKLDMRYTIMEDEPDSGHLYFNLGFKDEAVKQADVTEKRIVETGCSTLVVLSPADYYTFCKDYKSECFNSAHINVKHISSFLADSVKSSRKKKIVLDGKAAYHDSSYLCRYMGMCEQPRKALERILKERLCEMRWSGKHANSSGSSLLCTYPQMALAIARKRLDEAIEEGIRFLIVSSAESKESLSKALKKEDDIEIIDMVELFDKYL